jgi:hypothetical protein
VNTYRVVPVSPGRWAVEWSADGKVIGPVYGTFDSETEALFAAYGLSRMEAVERPGL